MKFLNLSRRIYLAAGIALLAIAVVSGEQASAQTPKLPAQPRINLGGLLDPDKLTPEIQPRDPATDNGEAERIVYRNGMGIVRKIEVSYDKKFNTSALILKDEHGTVSEVAVTTTQGTFSGRNGIRGITNLHWVSPTGVLLLEGKEQDGGYSLSRFSEKDGSLVLVQVTNGAKRTDTLYENDRMVAEDEYDGKVRLRLKVYFEGSGRLQYDEKLTSSDPHAGAVLDYTGVIYDADGKATHRVQFNEGPYDDGVGKIRQVEVLGEDGAVTQTIPIEWGTKLKVPLGSYKDQDELIQDKRIVFTTSNNAHSSLTNIEASLALLLADTTK